MDKTTEIITKQAKAYSGFDPDSDHIPYIKGLFQGYQTGATAENNRAQPAIDTLEQIANSPTPSNEREVMSWIHTARTLAETALQQWNAGKEEEQEQKSEGWPLVCEYCGKRDCESDHK